MKRFLVYFLLLALSAPILSPWGTVTYFVLNREYIKTRHCENINRPFLNCDGKCYLAKKLKQQQEASEKEALESMTTFAWSGLYFQETPCFSFEYVLKIRKSAATGFLPNPVVNLFLSGIFRPPKDGVPVWQIS